MMGRIWILFPSFKHSPIAIYDYTATIVIFYYCFIIAWNLKCISHPMHKIKAVESSLHFMKHEKIMRRDWNHKEPPEIRWAKSFLKIKKKCILHRKRLGERRGGMGYFIQKYLLFQFFYFHIYPKMLYYSIALPFIPGFFSPCLPYFRHFWRRAK